MLPEGWKAYSLIDITKWSSGNTPSKSENDFWGGDIPWISAVSMRGIFYSDSNLKVTEKALKHSAKVANENDILLLVRGSMLWNKIPVGIATRIMAFNQDVKCIKADTKKVDVRFLLYWFLAKEKQLLGMVTGTGIGAGKLDTNELQSLDIYLPCLPEQKKIAQILSTWDNAISATERLLENSQQRKKALMQQLLTGKKRLPGFEGEWKEKPIAKTGKVISGGTPDTSKPDLWDGDVQWLTPTDITALSTHFIYDTPRKITQKGVKESSATLLPPGSLCVCTRASVGLMAISTTEITTNQGFKSVVPNEEHDVIFLYYLFALNRNIFIRYPSGSTFLELSKKDFERLVFIYPPFSEQQAIANVLTTADQEIVSLQKRLDHLKQEKKALMQQLLTGKRRVQVDDAA